MPKSCLYGFGKNVSLDFESAVARAELLLEKQGFQVYTRLTVQDIVGNTLRNVFGRYLVLGACNPNFARELFQAEPDIGLMIPCNIAIYELPEGGCRVMIKDPARIMDLMQNPIAIQASMEVKEKLEQIIDDFVDGHA